MKIVLLAEAQRRFEAEDEWWRERRDAKELFIEELERTLALLGSMPGIGRHVDVVVAEREHERAGRVEPLQGELGVEGGVDAAE